MIDVVPLFPVVPRHRSASQCVVSIGVESFKYAPFEYRTVTEDADLETIAGLLHEASARTILTATSVKPMTAKSLSKHCAVSLPTVYRWTERLEAAGLIAERTRPRSDGHHDTVYVATFESLSLELHEGTFDLTIEHDSRVDDSTEDSVDRLTRMWENL